MQCLVCKDKEADFDPYLCQSCASAFQFVGGSNRELGYSFLFRLFQSYFETLREKKSSDAKQRGLEEPQYSPLFVSPAVTFANARRLHYFFRLTEKVKGVGGDWIECGVEYGQSLFMLATILYDQHPHKDLWAFDSFRGPFQVSGNDAARGVMFRPNLDLVNSEESTLVRFMAALNFYGLPSSWVTSHLFVVQGYYHETLSMFTGDKIGLLHLDSNYYDGVKTSLDTFYPKMSKGGIIIFDEYSGTWDLDHFRGSRRAIDEFLEQTGEKIVQDEIYGKYHIVVGA